MKVLLDTSAINWLTDNPDAATTFFAARAAGRFQAIVTPEVADEIRRTKDAARLDALEETPTRVPRLGVRLGLARVSLAEDRARLAALDVLRDGQDANLAANAGGYGCDVFLTGDREMSRQKRAEVEAALGQTRVVEPEEFVAQLLESAVVDTSSGRSE
jgi:predicted nucleic acid-binding protein